MKDNIWQKRMTALASRYREAFKGLDDDDYPREANAVCELASMIAGGSEGLSKAGVLLEVPYWHQEWHGVKPKRTYADIWSRPILPDSDVPELFVELKLGHVQGKQLGTQSSKTLKSYAYDVWRLLCLAARDKRKTECVFVIVAFGKNLPKLPASVVQPMEGGPQNAHEAYERLRKGDSNTPLSTFVEVAGASTGAEVITGSASGDANLEVQCHALRWVLNGPWKVDGGVKLYEGPEE